EKRNEAGSGAFVAMVAERALQRSSSCPDSLGFTERSSQRTGRCWSLHGPKYSAVGR
ncbi:hypothetical protein A2U01_0059458, partial [Trifolium medium]|nr:hypothetical protein [Trifolium medium]